MWDGLGIVGLEVGVECGAAACGRCRAVSASVYAGAGRGGNDMEGSPAPCV